MSPSEASILDAIAREGARIGRLEREPDLDPLRSCEKFKKLLTDLEQANPAPQ